MSVCYLGRISKSTAGGRYFSYLAPKLWDNLPIVSRKQTQSVQVKLEKIEYRAKVHLFQ